MTIDFHIELYSKIELNRQAITNQKNGLKMEKFSIFFHKANQNVHTYVSMVVTITFHRKWVKFLIWYTRILPFSLYLSKSFHNNLKNLIVAITGSLNGFKKMFIMFDSDLQKKKFGVR